MEKQLTQKEALELVIRVTRDLMESTTVAPVQNSLEAALQYLGQVRGWTDGQDIYDSVLLMGKRGNKINVEI